jgi:hypothetical protein
MQKWAGKQAPSFHFFTCLLATNLRVAKSECVYEAEMSEELVLLGQE